MLYVVLLVIFLIQFLVVLGALTFAVFLARPEVPFLGGGLMERTAKEQKRRGWGQEDGAILNLEF
jgi:hypothetical protein